MARSCCSALGLRLRHVARELHGHAPGFFFVLLICVYLVVFVVCLMICDYLLILLLFMSIAYYCYVWLRSWLLGFVRTERYTWRLVSTLLRQQMLDFHELMAPRAFLLAARIRRPGLSALARRGNEACGPSASLARTGVCVRGRARRERGSTSVNRPEPTDYI